MNKVLEIDGSYGEGGGQIIRTSLALSLITGTPIHIQNIRAGRKKSGLLRQHLMCVKAAKAIGHATVIGDELGSSEITFTPHTVQAGHYEFDIGSAGSTTLVLQTILPALMRLDKPSTVRISGGTHNPMAPPIEYIQHTFIPFLQRLGFNLTLRCEQAGFAPQGGGTLHCEIAPQSQIPSTPLDLNKLGALETIDAYVVLANLDTLIAQREYDSLAKNLDKTIQNLLAIQEPIEYDGISCGNMAVAVVRSKHHSETFTELGQKNITAEKVGQSLARQVNRYLKKATTVDEYTADQFLLPLALTVGGRYTARIISEHTSTQAYMIERFLDVKVRIDGKQIDVHV